jgi:hypothetical protein
MSELQKIQRENELKTQRNLAVGTAVVGVALTIFPTVTNKMQEIFGTTEEETDGQSESV